MPNRFIPGSRTLKQHDLRSRFVPRGRGGRTGCRLGREARRLASRRTFKLGSSINRNIRRCRTARPSSCDRNGPDPRRSFTSTDADSGAMRLRVPRLPKTRGAGWRAHVDGLRYDCPPRRARGCWSAPTSTRVPVTTRSLRAFGRLMPREPTGRGGGLGKVVRSTQSCPDSSSSCTSSHCWFGLRIGSNRWSACPRPS